MEKGKKNIIVLLAVILLLGCGFTENIRAEGTETQCSVTFVNEGNIIGMLVYEYNALLESEELPVATKPSDDNYTYKFKMWADDKGNQVVRVTDDITVYAVYSSKKIKVDVDKPDKDKPEKIEEKEEEKKPHKDDNKDDGNKNDGNKNDNKDDSNRDDSNKDDSNKNDGNNDDSQRDSEQENKGSQSSEKDGDSQATTETAEIPSSQKADSESVSTQQVSTESETVDIPEQDIPEGAKEDNCTIHVIVMLLCLSLVCYTIARIVLAKKENEVEDENA